MQTNKSNRELLLLIKKDDQLAFYHLYERYSKRIYGFVLKYLKVEKDAEEIVQEVFIKIWEKRKTINTYSSFESFLFTVAYNATISLLRKRVTENKYLTHLKSIQKIIEAPELTNELYFNELNQQIESLLNKLSPRQREVFELSRKEGLSHEQIAIKLNITVNTVKKHISNTISFLKSHVDNSLLISSLFFYLFII